MVKRKAAKKKKIDSKKKISSAKKVPVKKNSANKKPEKQEKLQVPMSAFLLQILAVILAGIMIVALTLFVLGKMSGKGFWYLTILLAIIAFVIMPVMRKKFLGQI